MSRSDEALLSYGEDWHALEERLRKSQRFDEGYTLLDVVDVGRDLFTDLWLIRLLRFQRGDEIIVYSENALGERAGSGWIAPKGLFEQGFILPDDRFYFVDDKGDPHPEVKCRILKRGGGGASFVAEIQSVGKETEIPVPSKWAGDHHEYATEKLPIVNTTKRCSIALHKYFGIYDEPAIMKRYNHLGERNFRRVRDNRLLWDLKEEYRRGVS